jgi:hypothetical protein
MAHFVFQVSFSCQRKIDKINTYSIMQLRSPILCKNLSICVSLFSSGSILKAKYLVSIDREFSALYFHDLFKASCAVVQDKKA